MRMPFRSPPLAALLTLGGLLVLPALLWANGGTLRLNNVPMGGYLVSAFTDPTPVQPDSLDVSVLAVFRSTGEVAPDLSVTVRTRHVDGTAPGETREATREQADDPRYYATKFGLGAEGTWELTVAVSGPQGGGEASFQIRARDRGLLGNPWFLTLMALLPLLLIGGLIARSGGKREDEAASA
jgi:hypothetical protein